MSRMELFLPFFPRAHTHQFKLLLVRKPKVQHSDGHQHERHGVCQGGGQCQRVSHAGSHGHKNQPQGGLGKSAIQVKRCIENDMMVQ